MTATDWWHCTTQLTSSKISKSDKLKRSLYPHTCASESRTVQADTQQNHFYVLNTWGPLGDAKMQDLAVYICVYAVQCLAKCSCHIFLATMEVTVCCWEVSPAISWMRCWRLRWDIDLQSNTLQDLARVAGSKEESIRAKKGESMREYCFCSDFFWKWVALGPLWVSHWRIGSVNCDEARLTMHKWKKDGSTYFPNGTKLRYRWQEYARIMKSENDRISLAQNHWSSAQVKTIAEETCRSCRLVQWCSVYILNKLCEHRLGCKDSTKGIDCSQSDKKQGPLTGRYWEWLVGGCWWVLPELASLRRINISICPEFICDIRFDFVVQFLCQGEKLPSNL